MKTEKASWWLPRIFRVEIELNPESFDEQAISVVNRLTAHSHRLGKLLFLTMTMVVALLIVQFYPFDIWPHQTTVEPVDETKDINGLLANGWKISEVKFQGPHGISIMVLKKYWSPLP